MYYGDDEGREEEGGCSGCYCNLVCVPGVVVVDVVGALVIDVTVVFDAGALSVIIGHGTQR